MRLNRSCCDSPLASVAVDEALDGLVLRYDYRDTNGTGELWAQARYGEFAGASSAWFSDHELLRFEHVGLTVASGVVAQRGPYRCPDLVR